MKKYRLLKYITLAGLLLIAGSCKEDDLIEYEEASNIYFMLQRWESGIGANYKFKYPLPDGTVYQEEWTNVVEVTDSIIRSYARDVSGAAYDTVYVPISLLGAVTDYDREFKYEVGTTSTAVEGKDFVILDSKVPANYNSGAIVVKVDRLSMKDRVSFVDFNLLPNNEFQTQYNTITRSISDTTQVSLLKFRLVISDLLEMPESWDIYQIWFGSFSRKKLYLIAELTGESLDELYIKDPNFGVLVYWAQMLKRHLLQQEAMGNPVMEEDGVTPMEVGTAA